MQRIAIYDLDRTLTRRPTWSRFLLFVVARRQRWRLLLLPMLGVAAVARAAGLIGRTRLKELMHRAAIGASCDAAELAALADAFAGRELAGNIPEAARAQIAADRAEGRRIVIATAAHRFYAGAIADRLDVEDLVATEATRDARGRIGWRIGGDNCYGAAKQGMVAAWLAAAGIDRAHAHVRFYSDHVTDLPSFEWADEAVVVNARGPLAALAEARGWRSARWN